MGREWYREPPSPSRALSILMAGGLKEEPCSHCGTAEVPEAAHTRSADVREEVQMAAHTLHETEAGPREAQIHQHGLAADHSGRRTVDSEAGRKEEHTAAGPNSVPETDQPAARIEAAADCCWSSWCLVAVMKEDVARDAGQDYHPCRPCCRNTSLGNGGMGEKVLELFMQFVWCLILRGPLCLRNNGVSRRGNRCCGGSGWVGALTSELSLSLIREQ